jgi:hypothetical protein
MPLLHGKATGYDAGPTKKVLTPPVVKPAGEPDKGARVFTTATC